MVENNITGKDAYISWVWSGGTLNLNTDYRSVSVKESVDTAETTAGADTHKTYLPTIKSASIDYSGVFPTGGTALYAALASGMSGTLTVAPEGTATGKVSHAYPAICMGATYDTPYAGVVTVNCTFQSNGAWS